MPSARTELALFGAPVLETTSPKPTPVKTVVYHSAQDLRIENIELPAFGEPLSMRLHATNEQAMCLAIRCWDRLQPN